MLTAFIGIQTGCVILATSYVIKNFKAKKSKLKIFSNDKGYKIYKTF